MQVQVTGKHVDMGEALRSRITDELQLAIGKYFERGGDADVVLTRDGHSFRVDCAVRLASGQRLDSHGMAADAHAAFDTALAKVETELLRDHLGHCIEGAIVSGNKDEQRKKAEELIELLQRATR